MGARQRKYRNFFIGISVVIFLMACRVDSVTAGEWATVRWVDDGDTILLEDGRRIRYIGINAPEIENREYGRSAEPWGDKALACNKRLVHRRRVRLEFDREKKDRYDRWLAYVFLPDGRFVNRILLEAGMAYVLPHHPNTAQEARLLSAQRRAMSARRGLWQQAGLKEAVPYRGSARSRRFHRVSCPFARKIGKDNRVAFTSRWDAFWAGFAPAKGCIGKDR